MVFTSFTYSAKRFQVSRLPRDPTKFRDSSAGQSSVIFGVRTNATNFIQGFTSVIDGGTADYLTFQPARFLSRLR